MTDDSMFRLSNPEIYVVTTSYEGQRAGQIVTWVSLASLVPERPRVVIVLSPETFTSSLLKNRCAFVLHMLAAHQTPWIERFGMQSGYDIQDKFAGIDLVDAALDIQGDPLPVLPQTCGWAFCKVCEALDLGDRVVWVADVVEQCCATDRQPLRRQEGLAALPEFLVQTLQQQRLADIERDRQKRSAH